MDIFSTTITAGGLILNFLAACSDFTDDAKSLKARFDWDLRAIQTVRDYFQQRLAINANNQLSPEDEALLERTSGYLGDLMRKVERSLEKIERNGWLQTAINRAMWEMRQSTLQNLEREVFEWAQRFNVRILGLPAELRAALPAADEGNGVGAPAVVRSSNRLREFIALAKTTKEMRSKQMLLEDPDEIISEIEDTSNIATLPLEHGDKQLILSSRRIPQSVTPGSARFNRMLFNMGELAAALNCLDPAANICLLRVEYYFYYEASRQFLFAHAAPYPTTTMMTLEEMITFDAFPKAYSPLNKRLKLAYKLAEGVFFLHTAGFLHKNITSSSIVALQRPDNSNETGSSSIDDVYLMGYDLIRGTQEKTSKEGANRDGEEGQRSIWEFDIYQHADRLKGMSASTYIGTYDLYSLGVVLLEIGFWQPLIEIVGNLYEVQPSGWTGYLVRAAMKLSPRIGIRYQRLVLWCLKLGGNQNVNETEFMETVLDPLEDMANAMS